MLDNNQDLVPLNSFKTDNTQTWQNLIAFNAHDCVNVEPPKFREVSFFLQFQFHE